VSDEPVGDDPIATIALLAEPNRQRLYDLVVGSAGPVGRDDAAAALGMSRELAAFHLDRLADAGLLVTEHHRRGTRTGPGAGRPAKFYRRARLDIAVTLPPRHYDLAADLMATALDTLGPAAGADALARVAHVRGAATGDEARRTAGQRSGHRPPVKELVEILSASGFEPQVEPSTGTVSLRNCPYNALTTDHRDLTCGMNLAWAEGVVAGWGGPATVELDPAPGRCCVTFHTAPQARRHPSTASSDPRAN
jgi:predicted ArsR family transcriptional regulator